MWAHDYCTVCDKQCSPGSMYCSDTCRLCEQDQSGTVSFNSDTVYSTLYTTGRHHNLSSPLHNGNCENAHCKSTGTCYCASTIGNTEDLMYSPALSMVSPALTVCSASSPMSLQSLDYAPPLSPLLLAQRHNSATGQQQRRAVLHPSSVVGVTNQGTGKGGVTQSPAVYEFTNTSTNYKRWLSSVI